MENYRIPVYTGPARKNRKLLQKPEYIKMDRRQDKIFPPVSQGKGGLLPGQECSLTQKKAMHKHGLFRFWRGRRDSNPRPPA
jgi:hypothetical protein